MEQRSTYSAAGQPSVLQTNKVLRNTLYVAGNDANL